MYALRTSLLPLLGPLAILLFGLACSTSEPTATPMPCIEGVEQTTQTASYRIELKIGPVVMLPSSDMAMPDMSTTDQEQPVNHHLELHIYDKTSGERVEVYDEASGGFVKDVLPTIRITDQATGTSRLIESEPHSSFLLACVVTRHRETDRHFGDNLYLPNGSYTFALGIGNETAVVENFRVQAAAASGT